MMRQVRFRPVFQALFQTVCLSRIAFTPLIFAGVLLPCRAQPQGEPDYSVPSSFQLDPFFAYEFGRLLSLERTPGSLRWCDLCSGEGISYNHLFRFGASALFPEFPSRSLGGGARFSLGFSGGEFVSDPFIEPIVDPQTNERIPVEREFTVNAVTATLGLDLLLRKEIGEGWSLQAGPWLEYRILSRFVHTERILGPGEATFSENGSRTRTVAEGDLLGSLPFGGGLLLSLSRRISLSRMLGITPELYTRMNGEAFARGLGVRSFSAGIGVAVHPAGRKRPESPSPPSLPPPAPSIPPLPRQPVLAAHVDLFCVDASGARQEQGQLFPRVTRIRRRTPPPEERIVRDFHAPQIRVSPEITAAAGVRWWGLSIRQGEVEIARATSDHPSRAIDLNIRVEKGEAPVPLTAELLVEDSTGAVAGARDRLMLLVDSAARAMPEENITVEEEWWVLAGTDGNPSPSRTEQEKETKEATVIAEVGNAFYTAGKEGKEVKAILYFLDRPEAVTEEVRTERIESVATTLKKAGIFPQLSNRPPDISDPTFIPDRGILIVIRSTALSPADGAAGQGESTE